MHPFPFPTLAAALALAIAVPLASPAENPRRVALDGAPLTSLPIEEPGKDGLSRVSKVPQPGLEIYPAPRKPARGTILVCPGGGYSRLAIVHEGRALAPILNEAGWDVAILLYRVGLGEETRALALADAKAAFALLQTGKLGLSTATLGVVGFSAGGHLTARLARETSGPAFLGLIYAAYLDKDGKCLDDVAPTKAPAFLYVAADDRFVSGAKAYDAACRDAGTKSELHIAEKGGHGFGMKADRHEAVRDWPDLLLKFLDSVSRP